MGFAEQNAAPKITVQLHVRIKINHKEKEQSPKIKNKRSEDEAFIYATVISSIVRSDKPWALVSENFALKKKGRWRPL